jgi:tetratricopeptide (TPR) repeat protein
MSRHAARAQGQEVVATSHESLPRHSRRERLGLATALVLVAALVAAVDWPVLGAQAHGWDDNLFVTNNSLVMHPSWTSAQRFFSEVLSPSSVGGYYLPLTMTSLMLDYHMGGRSWDFAVFHRTSLTLHVLNAVLLGLICYSLFGSTIPAALVALLFGLHPLTVEPVAWVSERKTLLATLFSFACILCYVRHARRPRALWLLASVVSYALALLSKPTVTSLPVLLMVLDWWPLKRSSRAKLLEKVPFFVLAIASVGVTVVSQVRTAHITSIAHVGVLQPLLQVCYLLVFYFEKILWPVGLSCVYAPPDSFAINNPLILLSVVTVAVGLLVMVLAVRRIPALVASTLIFVLALSPTFLILKWSHFIAYDRYVYFPALGVVLLVGAALSAAWHAGPMRPGVLRAALVMLALAVSTAEARGARAALANWKDSVALWRNAVAATLVAPDPRVGLGMALAEQGDFDGAAEQFRFVLNRDPNNMFALIGLGEVLISRTQYPEAIRCLQRACDLEPEDPQAAYSLGLAEKGAGNWAEAEAQFRRVLEMRPNDVAALDQLGTVLVMRGEVQEGIAVIRRGLALDPTNAHPHFSLALVLLHAGGAKAEALDHLRRAVLLRPDWVLPANALAWILATAPNPAVGDREEALRLAARAVERTSHRYPDALDTYAAALAASGQFDRAIETATEAVELAGQFGNHALAAEIQSRVRIYRSGRAYTDSSTAH